MRRKRKKEKKNSITAKLKLTHLKNSFR